MHPFVDFVTGRDLGRMLAQEHWYAGELNDPINVLFAELSDGRWIRFFFDAGVFFWSLVDTPTLPEDGGENRYRLRDCCVLGTVFSATLNESYDDALLKLQLTDGRVLQLHNSDDRSWIDQGEN
jgi:hypothetical protein